jgi:hypothetical protein
VQAAFFSRSPFFFYLHKDFLQNKRAERNYNLLRDRFWIHHEAWILLLESSLVQAAQLKTNLTSANVAMWLVKSAPNLRIPGLMPTPPLQGSFTSDGVASTYRMHPVSRDLGDFRQKKKSMPEF